MQHRLLRLLILLAFLILGVVTPASGKVLIPDRHSTGTATWQAAYEAFGTRTAEDGTNDERQRANTKDEDPTGLLNEGHRYRDLDAGVFISRDPAGFVDGPNVYAYVVQNPWTRFDPEGLSFQDMIDVIKDEGLGGTLRTMGNSAYNDLFGEVEHAATQGSYLASQTGNTAEGIGYAAFAMIGGKDLMEADKGRELTFAADGDVSTRQLSGEEMKAKAISGTLKLGAATVSAVTGGISTTRTTVGLTEKVVANIAKKEIGEFAQAPALIYRKGSSTKTNLTPRPVDKEGLSTVLKPPTGKSQVIDPSKFDLLEAIQDGADHASVRPRDMSRMQEWIDSRELEEVHEFTEELQKSIIRTEKN